MKKLILILLVLSTKLSYAQEASFGQKITDQDAIASTDLLSEIEGKDSVTLKVKGTVNEVCQAKGCWMTMDLDKDQSMRITFKDYGFFIPTNSSGKNAVVQGVVKKESIEVQTLRHYAKDAGKSDEEIEAITAPEISIVFVAEGVLITD